ncbi:Polyamine transporter-like protein 4 [Elsinoe fawcettii]|nr:Polyamine transporter-like protein 4 [Elsinoe fawcettii]
MAVHYSFPDFWRSNSASSPVRITTVIGDGKDVDLKDGLFRALSTPEKATEVVNDVRQPEIDPQTLDWEEANDPDNPLNWAAWKRYWHIVPPSLISFTATLGSSIIAPALPALQAEFNVGSTVGLLPLSLYVLALGCGPLLAAPLSETYGRRVVYLISTPLAAILTLGAGFAPNLWSLSLLRFLAGMSFSPSLAIGTGSVGDVTRPEARAVPSALYIMCPFLGPALGPVLGSIITVKKSWRWTQYTLIFFAIFSTALTFLSHETYKRTILTRRARRRGLTLSTGRSVTARARILLTITLMRPLHMLTTEPIVAFFSLYIAFNFATLFAFFAAFPVIFRTTYGFSTISSGLVFLSVGVGGVLAVPTIILCDRIFYQRQFRLVKLSGTPGHVAPEHRLYPALVACLGLPIGLFWFAWTARQDTPWISPVLAAAPFSWGNSTIFIAATAYLLDTYQAKKGASAMAASSLLRYVMGAVFPLFVLQMYDALGTDWATSLLGFVAVGLVPVPWVLFFFGARVRRRSAYDTVKVVGEE